MFKQEIKKLIEKEEAETIERKESLKLLDEVGRTISAYSNTMAGKILVGVTNSGIVVGVTIGKNTIEELANYIKRNTDPQIYPSIKVEELDSKKIILIDILESREKPVFFKRHAFKRVGKTNLELTSSEIRKIAKESGEKIYWDSKICEEAILEDIDEEKVKWFLRKAKYERNFDVEPETPVKEGLERLELIKNGKLTNAAILLFGKKPQKFFLQAETRCVRFKGTESIKPFIDMKVFSGNIIDQVDKSLSFVLEHISMKVYLKGKTEREEKYEYPADAIREAIINAVCHRDYETSTNIQIRIFDDRIEVWGCGHLPEPLKLEDLKKKHKSIPRNPLIAKCFFLIKFIEQWGTGTNDIIDMCLDWDIPEPLFEYVTNDFVITFRKSKLTEEYLEKLGLNQRQKKAVEYLLKHKKITNREYRQLNPNITDRTVLNDLNELISKDVVIAKGEKKYRYYILQ